MYLILIAVFSATGPPIALAKKSNASLTLGAGLTYTHYTEGANVELHQMSVTPKLTFTQFLGRRTGWNIGTTAFYSGAHVLKSSRSDPASFLGVNLRLGYSSRKKRRKLAINFFTGAYYVTMFVPSNSYGFQNMAGPQFFPVILNQFKKFKVTTYGKYSPVSSQFALLPFENYELAAGTSLGFKVGRDHWLSLSIDASRLQLIIKGVQVKAKTLTMGLSLNF